MNYHFRSAKITSPTTKKNYGGCFIEDDFMVLLEIETDSSIPALNQGRLIFDALFQKFKSSHVLDKNLIKILLREISGNTAIKTAIIGIIDESNLYLGAIGKGQVVLVRGDDADTVVSGGFISGGQIEKNDKLVFHSDRLAKIFDSSDLKKLYNSSSLEEFEEEMGGRLSASDKYSGCAVLAVLVTDKKNYASPFEIKGINFLEKITNKIKNLKLVFEKKTGRQKIFIILCLVLFFAFIINTVSGYVRAKKSENALRLSGTLDMVKSQYDEAQNLIDLNPVRSRELLASSKLSVSKLLASAKKNSGESKILTQWFEKISSSEISAYKIYKLTAVPVFFDVSLIKSQANIDTVSAYEEKKAVLDKKNKNIYFLDTKTKESAVLAGENIVKNAANIAIHGNFVYVLNEDGIYRIDIEKKQSEKRIEHDSNWGEIKALTAFAGNLYLLDSTNNAIWKYVATENGFSDRRSYLNQGIGANLSDSKNMGIDGSVYVAGNGNVFKFTSGNNEQFDFQGFEDTVSNIDSIWVSDSEKNIYILDKALKRIVVFDKDGLYHSQYQWEDLKNAKAIIATENEGKIYVFINSKIYAIDIK